MLIWAQDPSEEYGVGITFTLEIRPVYYGNQKLGKVLARISGEGEPLPDQVLWTDFSKDSGTAEIQ